MFRNTVTEFNKQMHVRPVMFLSVAATLIGSGLAVARAVTDGPEFTIKSYVEQNEINMRSLIERELSAELYLMFKTNPQQIPVPKRHIWQIAGQAEAVFNQIQDLEVDMTTGRVDPKKFDPLYRQWRAQIFDIYWTMLEQRGVVSHKQRAWNQTRQYSVLNLPPAIPFVRRDFPGWNEGMIDASVEAPAPDAPRSEFVKYYAKKYNVDL